ncbi:CpsD/CapB family tyrosine-protein kinase [Christensenellaceae bacterium NSJ-44]|jgi:capsular exopolysaccharide synthesis family protein|uniref:CpsD/CapB family tyrosine-protein kinase n=1 Tax=Luoshenia tenuis TaxID=2763654 RepID=A0A926D1C3_9FIRM|nr:MULTISPECIES: CpsD/CapB family tyrosine-protein kinase [Clostridia]MBC8529557.1 CpsD/CapB family tyrosine-protein kinase [Luoshenia tenuis]SCI75479.1 Tyrosine-protein kinase YwqD [uncultured Clostridium sp.]
MDNSYQIYFNSPELREAIKTLRVNIEFAGIDEPVRSVAVTSVEAGVGKSTIALSLAIAMAETGKTTLIIDNDFRNPQIANRLMVRGVYSLTELFSGKVDPREACVPTKVNNLFMLDLGSRRLNNPIEVLSSGRYKALLAKVKQDFDFVVIDTPPLGLFIDAAIASTQVDGVLMVISSGKSTAAEVKESLAQLEKANAHVIGCVLNNLKHKPADYYGYYYDKRGDKKRKKIRRKQ